MKPNILNSTSEVGLRKAFREAFYVINPVLWVFSLQLAIDQVNLLTEMLVYKTDCYVKIIINLKNCLQYCKLLQKLFKMLTHSCPIFQK